MYVNSLMITKINGATKLIHIEMTKKNNMFDFVFALISHFVSGFKFSKYLLP